MAKRKVKTPKQQWIAANKNVVRGATRLVGRGLDTEMEIRWRNERLARGAAAAAAAGVGVGVGAAVPPEEGDPAEEVDPAENVEPPEDGDPPGDVEEDEPPERPDLPERPEVLECLQPSVGSRQPNSDKPRPAKDGQFLPQRKDEGLRNVPDKIAGTVWQGGRFLGSGKFGVACLWFEADEHGTILKRLVLKDCYVSSDAWGYYYNWVPDAYAADREHIEIAALNLIKDQPGSEHVVRYITSERDDARRWYRIYMGFCPHGDLESVINNYKPPEYLVQVKSKRARQKDWKLPKERMFRRDNDKYRPIRSDSEPFIPEHFIWRIFESLVEASMCMERGKLVEDENDPGVENWKVIVHRDLKFANILLDARAEGDHWPRARIADFGMALLTDDNDINNPNGYSNGAGTPQFKAPEQNETFNKKTGRPEAVGKLLGPTNIYAVGVVILGLANRSPWGTQMQGMDDEMYAEDGPDFHAIAQQVYSDELRQLARRCVVFEPEERIGVVELRKAIKTAIRNRRDKDDDLSGNVLEFEEDNYRIGMAMPAVPVNPVVKKRKAKEI
ncbi:hypothetical protein LTR08_002562 [Meristemomyces frigidus]|nr:hypothetical protein LTR08_002562 [Meristemomyces frigidus]